MSSTAPLTSSTQLIAAAPGFGDDQRAQQAAKVDAIQYARAVAALLVVFYHQTVYMARMAGDARLLDVFGVRPGIYGVVTFFVLSGYLMADIAPKYRPATFIVHRVVRIYPTYWLCVLVAALFYGWLWFVTRPDADFVPDIQAMLVGHGVSRDLLRLTLAPVVFADFPLGIEWTLLYETTFYLIIFGVSLAGQLRFLPHLAIGWLLLIVWTMWFHPGGQGTLTTPSLTTLPFFGINSAFIFGVLAASLRRRLSPVLSILAGLVLLALVEVFPHPLAMVQAAAGLAALVTGLMALERDGKLARLPRLRRLGDWSYAIYLVHVPVILAAFKLMGGIFANWLIVAVATVAVLLASAGVGQLDLAAYRRLKAMLDGAPATVRTAIASTFVVVFLAAAVVGLRSR